MLYRVLFFAGVIGVAAANINTASAEYVGFECDENNPDFNCCPWGPRFPTVDVEPNDFDDCVANLRLPYMP